MSSVQLDHKLEAFYSIRNHLSYYFRKDLSIYKSCELESTFIDISNPSLNIPRLTLLTDVFNYDLNKLNDFYLNDRDKLSKEKTFPPWRL